MYIENCDSGGGSKALSPANARDSADEDSAVYMLIILYIALSVAVIGTASSAVFLGLARSELLAFMPRHDRQNRSVPEDAQLPPVSVLKPVHGLEAQLKENIESFFRQDYPHYEILFAADRSRRPGARGGSRSFCALPEHPDSRSGHWHALAQSRRLRISLHGGGGGT